MLKIKWSNLTYRKIMLLFAIFFVSISTVNILISRQLKRDASLQTTDAPTQIVTHLNNPKLPPPATHINAAPKPTPARQLIPADPAQYGIVAHKKGQIPLNTEQWESHYRKVIQTQEILNLPGASSTLEQIQTTPEAFAKQMQTLEGQIIEFKQKSQDNPFDPKVKNALTQMYKLKALANVLKEHVITTNPSPASLANHPGFKK